MFFVRRGYFLIHDTDPGQWRLCKAAPLPPLPLLSTDVQGMADISHGILLIKICRCSSTSVK